MSKRFQNSSRSPEQLEEGVCVLPHFVVTFFFYNTSTLVNSSGLYVECIFFYGWLVALEMYYGLGR